MTRPACSGLQLSNADDFPLRYVGGGMMDDEPTEEEKKSTLFWDGLAAVIFLIGLFLYRYWEATN
jgi:hypothetical protein